MGTETMILIGLALVFGFYMAWNIGANDVANAMGTSVGSGALTLKRAVILAAIMEFAGAFFVGPNVTETVRKGIVDPAVFVNDPTALVLGMIAALLAAGVWLQVASYFGWPVSTTHAIVGAIIGFGAVVGGLEAINWSWHNKGVAFIAASWVVSPLLSGFIAFVIFRLILTGIFYKPDPVAAAKKATPFIVFAVMVTMMLVLAFKGLKPFWQDNFGLKPLDTLPLTVGLSMAFVAGTLGALISHRLVGRIKSGDPVMAEQSRNLYLARALSKAMMHLRRVRDTAVGDTRGRADRALQDTQAIHSELRSRTRIGGDHSAFVQVERIFIYLQIISAGFVAFAHGSNDVANAIGPLATAIETAKAGAIPKIAPIPLWILGLGAVGIVFGLATWGWRVMRTIGERITELTPSRGFCAEFAAALTVLLASVYGLPISTTHTLVGGVLGVGLARGIGALNLNTVRDIVVSWVVTLPAGAGLAIVFFYVLRVFF